MKTFKVTFFDKELDIVNVITYHNVTNQASLVETIAINIYTLDLHEAVKCESEGVSYTKGINELMKPIFERLGAN